jgi:cytoplasmic tRNA 2-thiolation protein 1
MQQDRNLSISNIANYVAEGKFTAAFECAIKLEKFTDLSCAKSSLISILQHVTKKSVDDNGTSADINRDIQAQCRLLTQKYNLSLCEYCFQRKPQLKRPKTGSKICKDCFFYNFENEIHETIVSNSLFVRGEKVCICASGGKDSTVLAHVMSLLNKRHDYGLELVLLSVDEGISGYRDDSLETVKRNQEQYGIPLTIVSYKELYGWSMDDIVKKIGKKNNCTFCGVFRRQALDRGSMKIGANKLVTGHNCDDIAETVVMNILRGDIARLGRCVDIITGRNSPMPRCKPFKYTYEKEIVMYAHYKQLDYFSTECIYSPFAYRGYTREFLKDLEKSKNQSLVDIIRSMEHFQLKAVAIQNQNKPGLCVQCGYMSSQTICKACVLLQGLNTGQPKLAIGK